ncbi:uncharacterized protein [Nicotiana sylvestris]|uniref:C2 domain-containing protein n=2 Tax=Nicotiana TaxID=4085 RepID=A0A1S4CE32_TOBAC|nr:PREDICTED: uncharacterized protein LOC104239795 [Nicotiana sylvestris]XP_016499219.1 PREDICTED: uncharacterized protein LOC107817842 [Nicotiana tabacum]
MESNIQTPPPSSTITADHSSSLFPQPLSPHPPSASNNTNHILEITLISAQDLSPVCKSLRTYALTWVNPNRKRTTRVDNQGHSNPTWNDKFSFRVDDEFLNSESSAVHVEIYTVSWFRDILVGTVKVLLNNLINPFDRSKKFVALQIRRPSGNPQGILNLGVALIDKSKRSMPLFNQITPLSLDHRDILDRKINDINAQDQMINENFPEDEEKLQINNKIQLWQSQNLGYSDVNTGEFPNQAGSICNGSMVNGSIVNGSELCSDIGPSASIVAAEIAKKLQPLPPPRVPSKELNKEYSGEGEDGESSILEELTAEEAYAKGLALSTEGRKKEAAAPEKCQRGSGGHPRRNTDGGLYSCFGNAYCFEFTIVCGASNNNNQGNRRVNNSNSSGKGRKKLSTDINSA